AQLGDGLVQHVEEELEADGGDGAALLAAEDVAGAAQLHVERGDLEAGAQVAEALEGLDAGARVVGELARRRGEEVAVRALLAAADAAPQLVELREAEGVGAVDDHRVGA